MSIDGGPFNDYLVGTDGDDDLNGFAGNDIIDGGLGADDMDGGDGNDQFVVDNAGDVIRELLGGGNDTVYASVSYTLNAGAYVETLSTSQHNATVAINLTGNALASRIIGNYGDNILDGGGGADELIGLFGNDIYRVYSQDDQVKESAGQGNDAVYTSASYTLAAGQEIETLSTESHLGITAINLTGNALDNTLIGNYGANILTGGGGADVMIGLAGDDTYNVDSASDQVLEAFGEGNDRIQTSISYALAATQYVETLATDNQAGTAAIDLVGNQLNNTLQGNAGNNLLNGGSGADNMIGYGGDDTYVIDDAGDLVVDGLDQGNDLVLTYLSHTLTNGNQIETLSTVYHQGTTAIDLGGNDYNNTLIGNYGANYLNGNGGADVMIGLNGNDTYVADNGEDQIVEAAGGGTDILFSFVSYTLAAGQEVETISTAIQGGTATLALTGNELAQTIIGNNGANFIDGKDGGDVLYGLGGADTFAFTTALGAGNIDTLADFSVTQDKILLSATIFAGIAPGQVPGSAIVTGTQATLAAHRIIYNSMTGALLYDSDGVGGNAAVQFATLATGLNSADLQIFVEGPNNPPVAVADQKQADKTDPNPATGNVLTNDSDPDGHPLTVAAVQGNPANVGQPVTGVFGTLTINADGSYTYVVNNADPDTQAIDFTEFGNDVFTYLISDGHGGTASSTLTIVVTGGPTLTDADNLQGGSGYDTISLDHDTSVTTASLFRGYEAFILNTRRDEDNVDGHTYSFILDNDNAPNSGTVMTFDGSTLAADTDGLGPLTSEDVFIDAAAVTSYSLNVTTGAGNDTVIGRTLGTINTGAGNDIVKLNSVPLAFGGTAVNMGTGFDILDLSGGGTNIVLNFEADNRLNITTAVIGLIGTRVDGWDHIIGNGGTMGVGATTMTIYGATGAGTSLDDLSSRMENYTGLSIAYGQLFFGNTIAAYTGPLPNFTHLGGTFQDFLIGTLNFSQLSTGITINPGQNVKTVGGTDLFGANIMNYAVIGTGFDDHIDRSNAYTAGGVGSTQRFTLSGGDGNDYLKGGNVINGGAGDDHLIAVPSTVGAMMTGGTGADIFETPSRATQPGTISTNNPFKLLDFNVADDTIYIDIGLPGDTPVALTADQFFIGTAATTPDQRVIYNPANGFLLYDPNGSLADPSGTGSTHFATLPTGLTPTLADFFFI